MANTLSCPIPADINPLSPNGFKFTIDKLPEIQFFCQEANIPGIMIGDPMLANPFRGVPIPGDHLTYDTLNIKFLVDSSMENYIAVYNWIVALGFPQDYQQYINFISTQQFAGMSELAKSSGTGTLAILNNTNTTVRTLTFNDLLPVSIGSLTFASTNSDVQYLVGNAEFRFSYYTFA